MTLSDSWSVSVSEIGTVTLGRESRWGLVRLRMECSHTFAHRHAVRLVRIASSGRLVAESLITSLTIDLIKSVLDVWRASENRWMLELRCSTSFVRYSVILLISERRCHG